MVIKVECPKCQYVFSIELVKLRKDFEQLTRERDKLKLENDRLHNQLKDAGSLGALKDLFGGFK
jgi:regulator of replication initiation timing